MSLLYRNNGRSRFKFSYIMDMFVILYPYLGFFLMYREGKIGWHTHPDEFMGLLLAFVFLNLLKGK